MKDSGNYPEFRVSCGKGYEVEKYNVYVWIESLVWFIIIGLNTCTNYDVGHAVAPFSHNHPCRIEVVQIR